jgi:glutathione peroxidase
MGKMKAERGVSSLGSNTMKITWRAAQCASLCVVGALFVACTSANGANVAAQKPKAKAPAKAARKAKPTPKKETPPVLNYTMKSLSGHDVPLSRYAGKVVMIVNTASKCGFTPQYMGLQKLHEKYSKQGLAILGFPANDFGAQEPGSDSEIGAFCKANFGVTFDMFSKVTVLGKNKAPLFHYLTDEKTNPQSAGEIGWNFEKFLIGRDGKIVARFKSGVAPDAPELVSAVEAALKK